MSSAAKRERNRPVPHILVEDFKLRDHQLATSVRTFWRRFAFASPIHGVPTIASPQPRFVLVLWLILLFVFLFFSIRELIGAEHNFYLEPAYVKSELNRKISLDYDLGDFYIHIRYDDVIDFVFEHSTAVTEAVRRYAEKQAKTNLLAYWNSTDENVMPILEIEDYPILAPLTLMLGNILEVEKLLYGGFETTGKASIELHLKMWLNVFAVFGFKKEWHRRAEVLVKEMFRLFLDNGVHFPTLVRTLGKLICQNTRPVINQRGRLRRAGHVTSKTIVSSDKLCLKAGLHQSLRQRMDTATMRRLTFAFNDIENIRGQLHAGDQLLVSTGHTAIAQSIFPNLEFELEFEAVDGVDLLEHPWSVSWRPLKGGRCASTTGKLVFIKQLKRNNVRLCHDSSNVSFERSVKDWTTLAQSCGCWPLGAFSVDHANSSLLECTNKKNASSGSQMDAVPVVTNCGNEMRKEVQARQETQPCGLVLRGANSDVVCAKATSPLNESVFRLSLGHANQMVLEEIQLQTEIMVSNLGGILGIWLGGTFLAAAHFGDACMQFFALVFASAVSSKKRKSTSQESALTVIDPSAYFHGVSFISTTTSRAEQVFWLIVLLCSSGLGTYNTVVAITNYMAERTQSTLGFEGSEGVEQNLAMPGVALCFKTGRLSPDEATSESLENVLAEVSPLSKKKILQNPELSSNVRGWTYLCALRIMDMEQQLFHDKWTPSTLSSNESAPSIRDCWRFLELVETKKLLGNFSKIERLPNAMGSIICRASHLSPISMVEAQNMSNTMCSSENIVWFGSRAPLQSDVLCIRMTALELSPTMLVLGADLAAIWAPSLTLTDKLSIKCDANASRHLDIYLAMWDAAAFLNGSTQHHSVLKLNRQRNIAVSIKQQYALVSTTHSRCSEDATMTAFLCEDDCWARYIRANCQTTSMSFRMREQFDGFVKFDGRPLSSNWSYIDCLLELRGKASSIASIKSYCRSTCERFEPCQTYVYSSTSRSDDEPPCYPMMGDTIFLNKEFLPSFSVTEKLVYESVEDLLADIGGIASLWVGGSIFAIVHAVINLWKWIFALIYRHCVKRKPLLSPRRSQQLRLLFAKRSSATSNVSATNTSMALEQLGPYWPPTASSSVGTSAASSPTLSRTGASSASSSSAFRRPHQAAARSNKLAVAEQLSIEDV